MCGRYALYGPASRLREAFDAELEGFEFTPRYNAAPMQWLPLVRQRPSGERVIQLLRWGLVPSWAKDEAIATRLINARGESVADKPSFRSAFRRRRGIVPANGFYEWQQPSDQARGTRQPFYIHPREGALFGLAALWERWTRAADGEEIDTFTIVTTAANTAMRPLHDRMPVILAPVDYAAWLDGATPSEQVQALLQPCPEAALALHPVSRAVGNVRNEGEALIAPIHVSGDGADLK
ncbi:MAG TPA: SOS response-associated peptidase [Thauera sp.]|uniref:SOS response-associated peptidase n=1 Tax=Thauera sp. TaxID=1905334 RepID=UPI002B9CCA67|nr:SOS response-associated peptidase [Thauera sp.]HRP23883.1 SOS response-associated peptidase [Thauera sp.]HRP64800.1 SOS response-associated peptidase [Thauera sp.]